MEDVKNELNQYLKIISGGHSPKPLTEAVERFSEEEEIVPDCQFVVGGYSATAIPSTYDIAAYAGDHGIPGGATDVSVAMIAKGLMEGKDLSRYVRQSLAEKTLAVINKAIINESKSKNA